MGYCVQYSSNNESIAILVENTLNYLTCLVTSVLLRINSSIILDTFSTKMLPRDTSKADVTSVSPSICSDEGLTLETSAFESVTTYYGNEAMITTL